MKLRQTPGGAWSGTEKAFHADLKREGINPRTYAGREFVDVPTDKPGLLEFLTFHRVNVISPQTALSASDAAGSTHLPPTSLPAATTMPVDVEALRALHNPSSLASALAGGPEHDAIDFAPPVTNTAGQAINLDELFAAAPIPKQVELAVQLLDRLDAATRG
jgi:hypothetical protein